jgi:hypothetical protein
MEFVLDRQASSKTLGFVTLLNHTVLHHQKKPVKTKTVSEDFSSLAIKTVRHVAKGWHNGFNVAVHCAVHKDWLWAVRVL